MANFLWLAYSSIGIGLSTEVLDPEVELSGGDFFQAGVPKKLLGMLFGLPSAHNYSRGDWTRSRKY